MRRILTALACFALVASGWSSGLAQEAEYEPAHTEIITFDVAPAHVATFEMAIEKIVEAAGQAGLTTDYGWWVFRENASFTLVYPVGEMAYSDDPEQWMRQFQGTPGEETLGEAFGMLGETTYSTSSYVVKPMKDHSYSPAEPMKDTPYMHVVKNWLAPGKQEAHAENTKALLAILGEIEYPYEVHAYETVIGDGGLREYVIPFDNMAAFYGDNGLWAHLAAHEKSEAWMALADERMKLMRAYDDMDLEYVPGMSYWPETEMAGGGE